MSDIPLEVLNWFTKRGIQNYKTVQHNPRKGRWCFVFNNGDNTPLFLKWNDNVVGHKAFYETLVKEEYIYRSLCYADVTPHYIGDELFVTECLSDPKTIREYIKNLDVFIDEDAIFSVITQIIIKWEKFVCINIDNLESSDPMKEFDKYLYSTLLACPMNSVMSAYERKRNRIIQYVFSRLIKNKVNALINKIANNYKTIHGDLHLNNILIDNGGKIFLVDFEDSKLCLPELELAYFMCQVHVLLKKNKKLLNMLDRYIDENVSVLSSSVVYHKMVNIFDFTIRFNHAFV